MKPKLLAALTAVLAIALPATAAHAAQPGINIAGAPTPERVQEALATGAKTVRIFALWKDFEPGHKHEFPSHEVNLANTIQVYDDAIRALNAAGAQPLFVMTEAPAWANGSSDPLVPPADPADFADFLGRFAAHNKAVGGVAGYEIWNEPDESHYWHPAPNAAQYAAMLKAAYPAIKSADPSTRVIAAPTTGNNYDWIEGLYANGAGGSFDVAAVHTDTACLDRGPDQFYREAGRLARYTFLGYRTVREVMAAHGDDAKPIWMTELGWSSTNGSASSCQRGEWTGQKPSGVSDAAQAQFLTQAFGCLANDPYVERAAWFTLRDDPSQSLDELRHYGLLSSGGAPKPSWTAFRQVAAAGGGAPIACGDFDGPSIRIVKPAPGTQFVDKLDVQAAATDGGVGLARITFNYDANAEIRNFTDALSNDKPVGLAPWQGSGRLALGKHTITVTALDKNGNTSTASVVVEKVTSLAATLTPVFKLKKGGKVTCKKRACSISGSLTRGKAGTPSIGGKVAVEWQFRNKKGKWKKLVGGLKPAHKAFTFKAKMKYKGRWRVRLVYQGQAPWKKTTTKWVAFKVR